MKIMSVCKHTAWLSLRKKGCQIILETSDRPRRLLNDIQNVDEPVGVVLLIGNQTKSLALANFGLRNGSPKAQSHHGMFHLHALRLHAARPIVVVDGDVPSHNRLPRPSKPHRCHETIEKPFMERTPALKATDAANEVYSRLLSPFADIICVFVADIGGIESTVRLLAAWATKTQPSASLIRPALILVVPRGQKRHMQAAVDDLMGDQATSSLVHDFRRIRIISISTKKKGQRRQYQPLRQELLQSMELVQQVRLQSGWLFSARHMVEFLRAASENVVKSPCEQFDFIKSSREKFPISRNHGKHLLNFLKRFDDTVLLKQFIIPLVASSFILDQYPPGMHAFNPEDVFHTLYQDTCVRISKDLQTHREQSSLPILPFDLVPLVKGEVIVQYYQYERIGTSKSLRQQHLAHVRKYLTFPMSEETCFGCIQRKPQYRLPCGHWTCQTCVRIFQRPSQQDPWLFNVEECILCGIDTGGLRIRVKPETATTRILSIDGGGTRGRAPLEFLKMLQHSIALPYPVQRNFDVIYGTSSGAMIACALVYNDWPIEKCIEYFEMSSRLAFERRHLFRLFISLFGDLPVISPIVQFIISLLVDSKYSAKKLEMIQQDVYGQDRSIVDSKEANEMGVLLGVTLTSTDDTSTFVVTNYNGVGERHGNSDYDILKFSKGINSVPLWEILRCCTAAPYYFTPHSIKGVGKFQDGGLTFNNPAAIALKEASTVFPNTPEPSIVVSLGTGSTRPSQNHNNEMCSPWKDSFAARLFRAFWKQGDSSAAWKQLLGHQKDGGKREFFRFDIEFQTKPPALDDVDRMNEVGRIAREAVLGSSAMEQLAKRIRAELFIFELDFTQPPRFVRGVYECVGHILCRLRTGTTEFEAFMHQLFQTSASFSCRGRTLPDNFREHNTAYNGGNFRKTVEFHVPSRQHHFEVTLQEGSSSICNISGSPFTLEWLIEQQNMRACFGTSDHRKRTGVDNVATQSRKRRRL